MIARIAAILLALFMAGCQHTQGLTSIAGGESRVFEAPKCEVLGKSRYDQDWIDSQIEGGVAAFGWSRPKDRAACPGTGAVPKTIAKPVKKRGFIGKIKDRILPPKKDSWPAASAPVLPTPAPPEVVATPAPPKARDPVDELLDPVPLPPARRVH